MGLCAVWGAGLWFRVPRHEQFDPDRVYRAVALADYSESATAQVFLVTDRGFLWAVRQNECVCVGAGAPPSRAATSRELAMDVPVPPPRSDAAPREG